MPLESNVPFGRRRSVVFARNIALESPILTNTHNYAIQFQRAGWATTWLSKPGTIGNWFSSAEVTKESYGIHQCRLSFLFNYGGRVFNRHKIFWDAFPFFPLTPGHRRMKKNGLMEPDLFFSGSLETASLYKLLKPKLMIYNAHDAFSLYPNAPASTRKIEEEVTKKADLIVTTAETTRGLLISQYGIAPDRIVNLGHGVENQRFANASEPERMKSIPRPRVVCLGTLDMQDAALTIKAARELPDASFIFIGPGGDRLRQGLEAAGVNNSHFLGPIYQDQLPDYLSFCDVGIIGYDSRLKDSRLYGSNPMKRYDYAAAGLQTVSIELLEYKKTPSPMYIASTPEAYISAIQLAIKSPRYSTDEIRAFALANDWRAKYQALIDRLNQVAPEDWQS
jgi:glycosyltransferase involved in cell wall biosynthesis